MNTQAFVNSLLPVQFDPDDATFTHYHEELAFDPTRVVENDLKTEDDFAEIDGLRALVDSDNLSPLFWIAVGKRFFHVKMFQGASAAFAHAENRILQCGQENVLESHWSHLLLMISCTHFELGQWDQALDYCTRLLAELQEDDCDDPFCYVLSACCCMGSNNHSRCEEILKSGLDRFPQSIEILLALARWSFAQRQLQEAISFFEAAYRISETNLLVLAGLAICHLLNGLQVKQFHLYADQVLACTPISEAEGYQRGQICFLKRDYEEAKRMYQEAQIGPYYSEIWSQDEIYQAFKI